MNEHLLTTETPKVIFTSRPLSNGGSAALGLGISGLRPVLTFAAETEIEVETTAGTVRGPVVSGPNKTDRLNLKAVRL